MSCLLNTIIWGIALIIEVTLSILVYHLSTEEPSWLLLPKQLQETMHQAEAKYSGKRRDSSL